MQTLFIDKTKCNKDMLCQKVCPFDLFQTAPDSSVQWRASAPEFCINCGQCLAVCPTQAITLNGICATSCPDNTTKPSQETFNTVANIIKARRSIRKFKNTVVEKEQIETLVNLTAWSPTGRNGNPVCWKLTNDPQKIQQIAKLVSNWMENVPELKMLATAYQNGTDMILRSAPALVIAHAPADIPVALFDATIALSQLELAASANGLGTCWAGFLTIAASYSKAINALLGIPENHKLCEALMLGYPIYTYNKIPPRPEPLKEWL